jgi:hypothetical protein
MVRIEDLRPHPKNPNKHGDEQIALLAKNIRALGWRHPILVSAMSGYIVAGHARLEAAKVLNLAAVPVDVQPFASEADELAYLLADNRIAELADLQTAALKDLLEELDPGRHIFVPVPIYHWQSDDRYDYTEFFLIYSGRIVLADEKFRPRDETVLERRFGNEATAINRNPRLRDWIAQKPLWSPSPWGAGYWRVNGAVLAAAQARKMRSFIPKRVTRYTMDGGWIYGRIG